MNPRKARRVAAIALGLLAVLCPAIVGASRPLRSRATDYPASDPAGDAELDPSGALCGLVVDTLGVPVSQATVAVYQGQEPCGRSQTDPLGQFSFRGLGRGTYRLEVEGFGGVVRAWSARPSPPAAKPAALIVVVERISPY